ncbi:hypothetical protein ACFQT0_20500 [Hymenobacter humi]|uniref:Uncharacterized protein n=1 Tax=Hymenobacter humi TaxID=1411620 RepID=A0ABW2UBM4_9BACT
MKKNISINLQGIIFHIEEDGYDVLSRYLTEVKAHFAHYRGHEDIVADIEGRIAEIFSARLSPVQQVITLEDVEAMTAKMGRVSDFATDEPRRRRRGRHRYGRQRRLWLRHLVWQPWRLWVGWHGHRGCCHCHGAPPPVPRHGAPQGGRGSGGHRPVLRHQPGMGAVGLDIARLCAARHV